MKCLMRKWWRSLGVSLSSMCWMKSISEIRLDQGLVRASLYLGGVGFGKRVCERKCGRR